MTRRRVASVRAAGEALGAGRGMGVGFRRRLLLVVVVARTILEAAVVLEGRLLRRRRRRGWVLVRIRAGGTRRPSVVVVLVVVIQVPGVGGRGRRRRRRRLVVVQGPGIGGGRRRGRVVRRVPVVRSVVSVRVRRRRIGVIRRRLRLRRRRICVGIVVRIMRRRAVILHSRTTTPTTPLRRACKNQDTAINKILRYQKPLLDQIKIGTGTGTAPKPSSTRDGSKRARFPRSSDERREEEGSPSVKRTADRNAARRPFFPTTIAPRAAGDRCGGKTKRARARGRERRSGDGGEGEIRRGSCGDGRLLEREKGGGWVVLERESCRRGME